MELFKKHEVWLLVAIFLFFCILYTSQLTISGLWYDEAIEYYYSKYLTGFVPVNPVDQSGSNMYERICITYQPPLYNFLMYFWLKLFDSEASFRLAGIIITFVGAIGFYLGIRRIAGYMWGAISLSVYLSTAAVAYYALECGEYNLQLCMECWMLYYFVICLQSNQEKVEWHALTGFYLFAILSIYSQYGAAFFIVGLFTALCYSYIKNKKMTSLYRLIGAGIITCIVAIIPLYVFFVRIQMENQGSLHVAHSPVFVGSLFGGIPYSLYKAFHEQVKWIFSSSLTFDWCSVKIMEIIVYGLILSTLTSLFLKSKLSILIPSVIATLVSYTLFFILSACSLYAYNWWDGHLGCYNIIHYKRYVLFFVPQLLFIISIGIISICNELKSRNRHIIVKGLIVSMMTILFSNITYSLINEKKKCDVREATFEWLKRKDFDHKIVVQGAVSPSFMYYIQHSSEGNNIDWNNIIITKQEIHTPEEVERHLREIGLFELREFYFIGHGNAWNMKGRGINFITDLFSRNRYQVETLRPYKTETSLLLFSKHSINYK